MFHNGVCHEKLNECWEKRSLVNLGRFFCPSFSVFDSIFLTEPGNYFMVILSIKTCPTSKRTLQIICSVRLDLVWPELFFPRISCDRVRHFWKPASIFSGRIFLYNSPSMLLPPFFIKSMLTFVMYSATRKSMEFVRWTRLEKYYSAFITLEKSVFYYFVRETHPGAFSVVSRLQSKEIMLKHHFELQDFRICIWMKATENYFRMENIRKKWFSKGPLSGLSYYFDYLNSEVRLVSKLKQASKSLLKRLS